MKNTIEEILNNYLLARKENFAGHPMQQTVNYEFKNQIEQQLNDENILIKGSVGKGQWASVPWLCVFDKRITNTAQKGFYIVYLFSEDMSGVYLSLNQGYTWYSNTFKSEANNTVKSVSDYLRTKLRSDISNFPEDSINLHTNQKLGKGYQLGNIISKYYPKDNIPSQNDLINDLYKLIGIFNELKAILPDVDNEAEYIRWATGCSSYVDSSIEDDDIYFQNEIQNDVAVDFEDQPEEIPGTNNSRTNQSIKRNPQKAINALKHANYKCEINSEHQSFISGATGKEYVEAHHIIPLSQQSNYKNSLDVEANIVALCPNCHKMIHLGTREEKKEMTNNLLEKRKDRLRKCGIE